MTIFGSARVLVAAGALAMLAGCGITGNYRMNPGFANFSPGIRDTDREFALSLGTLPLKIAKALTKDDPELSVILQDIKAVRVYVYAVDGHPLRVRERIERSRARLLDDGWNSAVAVRDDGEFATALVRTEEQDRIQGLAVMMQDSEEVVLINLIGDIRPETFEMVIAEMGIEIPRTVVKLDGQTDRPPRTPAS